jgi:hypothetical protein
MSAYVTNFDIICPYGPNGSEIHDELFNIFADLKNEDKAVLDQISVDTYLSWKFKAKTVSIYSKVELYTPIPIGGETIFTGTMSKFDNNGTPIEIADNRAVPLFEYDNDKNGLISYSQLSRNYYGSGTHNPAQAGLPTVDITTASVGFSVFLHKDIFYFYFPKPYKTTGTPYTFSYSLDESEFTMSFETHFITSFTNLTFNPLGDLAEGDFETNILDTFPDTIS